MKSPAFHTAQAMRQCSPNRFPPLTAEDIASVCVGDCVKVGIGGGWAPGPVVVTALFPQHFEGLVNNDLVYSHAHGLYCDDPVVVRHDQVYSIFRNEA